MDDVYVAFEVLIHYFVQQPSYLLWCIYIFSTFIESLIFLGSFFQMFGHLLGPRSFDNP
jgi:hypothetical protein